jgi:hypothetical protein
MAWGWKQMLEALIKTLDPTTLRRMTMKIFDEEGEQKDFRIERGWT